MAVQKFRTPRGIRNNNPLNIRRSNNNWKGKIVPGSDSQFEQFSSMVLGIRAAFVILRTYFRKYNVRTIEDIISRWAPATENNVAAYVAWVEEHAQLRDVRVLRFEQKNFITRIAWAMAWYECGRRIDYPIFSTAYDLV